MKMNWLIKIVAKLFLARLPINYNFWKKLGLFKHGSMESPEYIKKIFFMHLDRAYPCGLPRGSVILEIGSGDSVASCLLSKSLGAKSYHIDVGPFATEDMNVYRRVAKYFATYHEDIPDLSSVTTLAALLSKCDSKYMTDGLKSLKEIPSDSVDYIWSHSVLEHIRKDELEETLHELHRILKLTGLSSHNIDFQDHLQKSLHNLRFSEQFWESEIVANSGFYTNRIPAVVMHKMFDMAGFTILKEEFGQWPELPVPRSVIHKDFNHYSDTELSNRTSSILIKPRESRYEVDL